MRLKIFECSADNDLRKLPPSREALREHSKKASYQADYLWMEAFENIHLPDPNDCGWSFDERKKCFQSRWQNEKSPVDIQTFISTCNCHKRKCKSCKCKETKCLPMCGCKRQCPNS